MKMVATPVNVTSMILMLYVRALQLWVSLTPSGRIADRRG